MKKAIMLVLSAVALGCPLAGSAQQILAFEDFERAALGNVAGQDTGTGFEGPYELRSASHNIDVVANRLTYTNGDVSSDGGAQCMRIMLPNDSKFNFSRPIPLNQDTLYLSFLFQSPTAGADADNEDYFALGLHTAGSGDPMAGISHRRNASIGAHDFSIRYGSKDVHSGIPTEPGQTYLLVLKINKTTPGETAKYDEMSLFINPSTTTEPEPDVCLELERAAEIGMLAGRIALAEDGDAYYIDNIRIATTWDECIFSESTPVARPVTISPDGGEFIGSIDVSMETEETDGVIRYTLDGSEPAETNGFVYAGPFTLEASATVRAAAFAEGKRTSILTGQTYTIRQFWTGEAGDKRWTTAENWTPAAAPDGADLLFDMQGLLSSDTEPNSIVPHSLSVDSLKFTNSTNENAKGAKHIIQIPQDVTLSVTGGTTDETVLFAGSTETLAKTTDTRVAFTGGGALAVDAPERDVLITKRSSNENGRAYVDLSGLSSAAFNVRDLMLGRYGRSSAYLYLSATNVLTAARLCIGDSGGSANGHASELVLGDSNEIQADILAVGGRALDTWNENSGNVRFSDSCENPSLRIRGRDGGDSRAELILGAHGNRPVSWKSTRTLTCVFDTSGGTIDARFGNVIMAEGRGMQNGRGGVSGTFTMDAGLVDALDVQLGIGNGGEASGGLVCGIINVFGGAFNMRSLSLAESAGAQNLSGTLNVSGGVVRVSGSVLLGSQRGASTNVVAEVAVSSGTLDVQGDIVPGDNPCALTSNLTLLGGALSASGEVRIENGTLLATPGAKATAESLVLTNTLATVRIPVGPGTAGGEAVMTVSGKILLGGGIEVVPEEGYKARGGEVWTIVTGGTRTGKFDEARVTLPEGYRVSYTPDGFSVTVPRLQTVLILR